MRKKYLLLAILLVVGCVPKKVNEEPILTNDDRVPDSSATVADASDRAAENQREARERHQELQAEALATCEPRVCEAVVRGELAIGMNESQVLVVTGTTEEAWSIRWSGESAVMSPLTIADAPHDVMGDVAMVQIAPAGVSRYAYREPSGIRLVASIDDASNEGRARAMAAQLVREGDDQAAAGDFVAALDRYDRASLLDPGDPMIDTRSRWPWTNSCGRSRRCCSTSCSCTAWNSRSSRRRVRPPPDSPRQSPWRSSGSSSSNARPGNRSGPGR